MNANFVRLTAVAVFAAACAMAVADYRLPTELANKSIVRQSCEVLAQGVEHREIYFSDPFGKGPVNANLLIIHWKDVAKDFSLGLATCGGRRARPTKMCADRPAVAVVNGTYHAVADPTTPYFPLKADGRTYKGVCEKGDTAFAFDKNEMPTIMRWSPEIMESYDNVISGDGIIGFKDRPTTDRRGCAPRTFAGQSITNALTVIGVCDGRTKESVGVDFYDVCQLLVPFGCENAVSFDGGGSSVMAIRARTTSGKRDGALEVVSNPSDNGKFDKLGERRVADAIFLSLGK